MRDVGPPKLEPGCVGRDAPVAVRGGMTLPKLAEQFDVHPNQIQAWRHRLLDPAGQIDSG